LPVAKINQNMAPNILTATAIIKTSVQECVLSRIIPVIETATIPGTVANVLDIPNNIPAYFGPISR